MTTLEIDNPGRCPLTVGQSAERTTAAKLPSAPGRRFVLLDRDGTLIVHREYLADARGVELLSGVAEGLKRLQEAGFGLAIITNQSGIGRRLFSYEQFYAVQDRLLEMLMHEGVMIDGVYFCPHRPEDECACRKPRPRLVQRAAMELAFNAAEAFVIGDSPCDMELARNVGAGSVLIGPHHGAIRADCVVPCFEQAADWILNSISAQKAA